MDDERTLHEHESQPQLTAHAHLSERSTQKALELFLKTPMWLLLRALYLMLAIAGLWLLIRSLVQRGPVETAILGAAVIAACIGWYVWRFVVFPRRKARALAQRRKELFHSDTAQIEYRFYDDGFTSSADNGREPMRLEYDDLRQILRGGDLILLCTQRRQLIALEPDGFVGGTEADFWRLMIEKCPRAVPKKRR